MAERISVDDSTDPMVIEPRPDIDALKKKGAAAVDLRLGTWFLTMKESTHKFALALQERPAPTL